MPISLWAEVVINGNQRGIATRPVQPERTNITRPSYISVLLYYIPYEDEFGGQTLGGASGGLSKRRK